MSTFTITTLRRMSVTTHCAMGMLNPRAQSALISCSTTNSSLNPPSVTPA